MKLSLIIPTYNEEKRLITYNTIENYAHFLKNEYNNDFEIIVVLNGCKDNTFKIVKKTADKYSQIKHINIKDAIGKGGAVVEGFKIAKGDLVGFVDADGSTSPEDYYDLVKNINNYDGIIASRYISGAVVNPKQSIKRRIISRGGNLLIRSLFLMPYQDTQCGAKLFRKEAISKFINNLHITKWGFDINLLYLCKKNKFSIKEYPTKWKDREGSTLNIKKASIQVLLSIIQLRIMYSPLSRLLKSIKPVIGRIYSKMNVS